MVVVNWWNMISCEQKRNEKRNVKMVSLLGNIWWRNYPTGTIWNYKVTSFFLSFIFHPFNESNNYEKLKINSFNFTFNNLFIIILFIITITFLGVNIFDKKTWVNILPVSGLKNRDMGISHPFSFFTISLYIFFYFFILTKK